MWPDEDLLKDCTVNFGRESGPGGQHRNKVATAAEILHEPTGIIGRASERRHQSQNRHVALFRLRLKLARDMRRSIDLNTYAPSELWETRRQGRQMPVNPRHRDYPGLLAEALDIVTACRWDVATAAGILGLSMSQLAKVIRHDKASFAQVNAGRTERGLPALK